MSLERIRRIYKVPAFRGGRVKYTPEKVGHEPKIGSITSSDGDYLHIKFDGDIKTYPAKFHPTWNLTYLDSAEIIRVAIEPHFAGDYRLEYDGKYVTLFGKDRNYVGFKFNEDEDDWYEEMVLIPVVIEQRGASPIIVSTDEKWIYIQMNCSDNEENSTK